MHCQKLYYSDIYKIPQANFSTAGILKYTIRDLFLVKLSPYNVLHGG